MIFLNHCSSYDCVQHAWGFHVARKGKFRTGATISYEQIKSQYSYKIRRLAEELFYSIKNEKAAKPSFYSLLAFKIQQQYWDFNKNNNSINYRYWANNGWLSPECDFFVKHKANVLKVKAASLIGKIVFKYVLK